MAAKSHLKKGDIAPDFSIADASGATFSLSAYKDKKAVALVFLRYAGCPICQLALQDLKKAYGEFEAKNVVAAVFVQSPRERVAEAASEFPFHLIPDPEGEIYGLYGVGSGGLDALLAPKTIAAGIKATLKGHMQGKMEGNAWQLPGDFVVGADGRIILARVGKNMGDNLLPEQILSYL
jgi:peroxiredoxin